MQFKEIIGQDIIKRRLIQTVRESRVSHAQLFFGPEGSRKLAIAIAYAQFINCRNKQDMDSTDPEVIPDSCGACPSCVKYQKLAHPDLHFIFPVATTKEVRKDPISRNFLKNWRESLLGGDYRLTLNDWYEAIGIENKQGIINAEDCSDILRTLSYKSFESEYKVMVIWMVEKLYHSAAPKILKILEEPPDKTLFLLVTENSDQIPVTILSRAQMVKVPKLKDENIIRSLIKNFQLSSAESEKIALQVNGNYNEAVKVYKNDAGEQFNFTNFRDWMRLCWQNRIPDTLDFVSRIAKAGRERQKSFLRYGSGIIRSGMLINYVKPDFARLNQEEAEWMQKFSHFIAPVNILEFADELEKAIYHIERNANPSILFMDLSIKFTRLLKIVDEAGRRR